jgi:serine phosphatase RsbU (regulator of sigma subunit)
MQLSVIYIFQFMVLSIFCVLGYTSDILAQNKVYQSPSNPNSTDIAKNIQMASDAEKEGDKRKATYYLNQAADISWQQKNYNQAIVYFEKSLQLNQEINNINGINGIYNNLGMIHHDLGHYEKALGYFLKNLEGRRSGSDKVSLTHSLINISTIYNNLNRHEEAVAHLQEALRLSLELRDLKQMRSCYGMLAETYEKAGNQKQMLYYFDLYRTVHEKVQGDREKTYIATAENAKLEARNLELKRQNQALELSNKQREIEHKDRLIATFDSAQDTLLAKLDKNQLIIEVLKKDSIAHVKDRKIKDLELSKKEASLQSSRTIRNFSLIGLLFLIVFITFLGFRYQEKQKTNKKLANQNQQILHQKNEIEEKNKDITDSINYAQRIQLAMMTEKENLNRIIPESFILFKPKDIVSGDFYWFEQTYNKILVAAVDCTGHGVPGALMSMLGSSFLRQIVNEGITESDRILEKLHQNVRESLNQSVTENRDGMDAALYVIDKFHKRLEFSGAHNPLIYIQNNQLFEIKGSRRSVGGYEYKEVMGVFSKTYIDVSVPTCMYVFSDGYQDQFGGPENRKFMIRPLKTLLLAIHQKPMAEQQKILEQNLATWKGEGKQIDDVLIIGAKIDPELLGSAG